MWTREKKVSGSFEFFMWSPNPLDKLHTRCVYVKCCVYLKRNQSSSTWASLRCMLKTFQISPLFSHWRKFLFSVDATIASIITSTGRRTHEKSMRISRMFKQRSRRRQRQPNSSCGAFSGPTTNYTLVDNQTSVLELGKNHIQNAWWSNLVFKWSTSPMEANDFFLFSFDVRTFFFHFSSSSASTHMKTRAKCGWKTSCMLKSKALLSSTLRYFNVLFDLKYH